ncbi:MAG: hypothetical protein Q7R52_05750 [archaeon]|nr:hypothetical protein [archaeon]
MPYPSNMPGSWSYKTHLIYENVARYWYFGDFGQFDYNLKIADKYLVEAKTLFEYKQYLLGYGALKKSDQYFVNIFPNLIKADKNGKNVLQKRKIFEEASRKHMEILKEMENNNPDSFVWEPEKSIPTNLDLKKAFEESIYLREKNI